MEYDTETHKRSLANRKAVLGQAIEALQRLVRRCVRCEVAYLPVLDSQIRCSPCAKRYKGRPKGQKWHWPIRVLTMVELEEASRDL